MKKERLTYYFSVEGETEKWYLDWLQNAVNSAPESQYMVKFDCKIQKDPLKRAKGMTILGKTKITHIFDRESEEPVHTEQFIKTLDRMKDAQGIGKNIQYVLGYSNFTFELWMILHKMDCYGSKSHRHQYLSPLNQAYHENFEYLDQYKHEDNFRRILGQLTLDDVREAIRRSKQIEQRNRESGYTLQKYKGYCYYNENPALSLWEAIVRKMEPVEFVEVDHMEDADRGGFGSTGST